jgi:hypothetical protein
MTFWLGIIVGALFAWIGFKIGFYQSWALLFNILISVYAAIFLGPELSELVPGAGGTAYSSVLGLIAVGLGVFAILYCTSYTFLTGQFSVTFPKLLDSLGSLLLGFLAGYLVWGFVGLLICMTSFCETSYAKRLGFCGESQQASLSYSAWWCDQVSTVVAPDSNSPAEKQLESLLWCVKEEPSSDPNDPNAPYEPNEP